MPGRKKSYGKAGDREKAASGTRHRKQSKEIKREKTESPPVALRRDSAGSGLDLDEPLTPTPANRKKKVSEQSSEREDDGWTIIPYPGDVLSPPPGVGAKGDNWAGKKGIGSRGKHQRKQRSYKRNERASSLELPSQAPGTGVNIGEEESDSDQYIFVMDNDFKPPSTPSKPPTPKAVLPQPYYMKPVRRPSPALQQPPPAYQLSERTMMPAYLRDGETSPFQRSLKDIKSSSKTFREKCKMTDDGVYLYGQGEDSFCGPLPSEMDPENAAAIPWQAQKKLKEMSGNKTREEKLEESYPCPRR